MSDDAVDRVKMHQWIRVVEDDRIGLLESRLFLVEQKLNTLIRMVMAHDKNIVSRVEKMSDDLHK